MRKMTFISASLLLFMAPSFAMAKNISPAEYTALSAKNATQLKALEAANVQVASDNVNPWGTAIGIKYMAKYPYDAGDLVAGANGFILPGWYDSFKASGMGTSDGGGM